MLGGKGMTWKHSGNMFVCGKTCCRPVRFLQIFSQKKTNKTKQNNQPNQNKQNKQQKTKQANKQTKIKENYLAPNDPDPLNFVFDFDITIFEYVHLISVSTRHCTVLFFESKSRIQSARDRALAGDVYEWKHLPVLILSEWEAGRKSTCCYRVFLLPGKLYN